MKANASHENTDTLFERLYQSNLFQTYREAFEAATGLPLMLKSSDDREYDHSRSFRNPFCALINQDGRCEKCRLAECSLAKCSQSQAHSKRCFASLKETAIPIRSGGVTAAFITTGQVFERKPKKSDFEPIAADLRKSGYAESKIQALEVAWLQSPVVSPEKYQGAVTLLAAFALQLSETLNRLMIEDANAEPSVVVAAKQFINANLENRITLDDVAAHVCVSPYYFCKVFKQATGMTLTEYVNRRRVEWAKRRLLNPQTRVTEVAYDVGYQSLSQFNRSFLKYVGMSPSNFREQAASNEELEAA